MRVANKKLLTVAIALLLTVALLVPSVPADANAPSAEETRLVEGINQARERAGVQPFTISDPLSNVARTHLQTGSSVFGLMRDQGISYRYACALRVGSGNADLVAQVLTRSTSAYAMQSRYDQVGVAIRNNTTMLIQIGGGTNAPAPPPQPDPKPDPKPDPTPPPQPPAPNPEPEPQPPSTPGSLSAYEAKVAQLVNAERAKYGLKPLTVDHQLAKVARLKSEDMRDKRYFSHTSPTYGSPFQMMRQFGITYRTAGENIAAGQRTPEAAMQGWMNSSGHRSNILNANFTHIGVGHAVGGSYGNYWTQMFIGK